MRSSLVKTTQSIVRTSLASAMIFGACPKIHAEGGAERFLFKDGQVWTVRGSTTVPLKKEIVLPNNILVSTNGTFKVGPHPARLFVEGQILGTDGMLTSPNGRIEPVFDHV